MSDTIFAEKDPAIVIPQALAEYELATGVKLAAGDPRRLHLQVILQLLIQIRALIDFAGKQNLLRYVEDLFIDAYAALWGLTREGPKPAKTTQRFRYPTVVAHTVPAGMRVSDGANVFRVSEDTTATDDHVDAPVECTVAGRAANGIAAGQIDALVDAPLVPGCTGTENLTETISGHDAESLEELRARVRDEPEARSTCGPANAYRAEALAASANVADAIALGPDDAPYMAGYAPEPGEVHVLIIQGERDDNGVLIDVEPEPTEGLLEAVDAALTPEDVRPLGDLVVVKAPVWVDFDAIGTYYIPRSRAKQASQIITDVEKAWAAYLLWQQSSSGRDINPDEAKRLVTNAGAKRLALTSPSFLALQRDEAARVYAAQLVYGGVEDD
jgi:phage-related baseplate assembly protein